MKLIMFLLLISLPAWAQPAPIKLYPLDIRAVALKQPDGPRCDAANWPLTDSSCVALMKVAGQYYLQLAKQYSASIVFAPIQMKPRFAPPQGCIASTSDPNYKCPDYTAPPVQIEPLDVAPILEEYGNPGNEFCDVSHCTFVEEEPKPCQKDVSCIAPPTRRTRPTCADKTRFLMTAEDGSKHCIQLVHVRLEEK